MDPIYAYLTHPIVYTLDPPLNFRLSGPRLAVDRDFSGGHPPDGADRETFYGRHALPGPRGRARGPVPLAGPPGDAGGLSAALGGHGHGLCHLRPMLVAPRPRGAEQLRLRGRDGDHGVVRVSRSFGSGQAVKRAPGRSLVRGLYSCLSKRLISKAEHGARRLLDSFRL